MFISDVFTQNDRCAESIVTLLAFVLRWTQLYPQVPCKLLRSVTVLPAVCAVQNQTPEANKVEYSILFSECLPLF